jgi:hypothetical protein
MSVHVSHRSLSHTLCPCMMTCLGGRDAFSDALFSAIVK